MPLTLAQRFHVKWKGYSHIHNTDETYAFLKGYKGFKKVENYIGKVWTIEQAYYHPAPDAIWKPSREEMEQYEIDKERIREVLESYKVVERILDEKEERRDGGVVTLYFCKWASECPHRWLTDVAYALQTCNTSIALGKVSAIHDSRADFSGRGDQGRCATSYR